MKSASLYPKSPSSKNWFQYNLAHIRSQVQNEYCRETTNYIFKDWPVIIGLINYTRDSFLKRCIKFILFRSREMAYGKAPYHSYRSVKIPGVLPKRTPMCY